MSTVDGHLDVESGEVEAAQYDESLRQQQNPVSGRRKR